MKPPDPIKVELAKIDVSINRARSAFSLHNARTWRLMLRSMGYPDEVIEQHVDRPITYKDIIAYGEELRRQILAKFSDLSQQTSGSTTQNETPEARTGDTINDGTTIKICTEGPSIPDSIYLSKLPGQTADIEQYPEQVEAARNIFNAIYYDKKPGILLSAPTGSGKTFVAASVIGNLIYHRWHERERTFSPWPYIFVTKASALFQTDDVFKMFGIDDEFVHQINIDQLRSTFGSIFIDEVTIVEQGEPKIIFRWKKMMHPLLFWWDENQILKNEGSQQSKIAQDVNAISERYKMPVYQLFMSATPYSRVSDARCFAVSTRIKHDFGLIKQTPLTDSYWPQFARSICGPRIDPYEYSPTAVRRFTLFMKDYIIRMPYVRPKFPPKNTILPISFRNEDERNFYDKAFTRFQARRGEIELDDSLSEGQKRMLTLAAYTVYAKAAELVKAGYIADRFVEWSNAGYAPGAAVRYKGTILKVTKLLINEHGWTRGDLSIIWGGSANLLSSKKKKAAKLLANDNLMEALKEADLDLSDLGFDFDPDDLKEPTEDEKQWERDNRMGIQNHVVRESERLRFQRQQSKGCLYTFKAGGVALSLHDGQFPTALPRKSIFTPVYGGDELVQGIGRFPRKTSRSVTEQFMVYYPDTIEAHVAQKVSQKLRCLRQVIRQKESWEDIILGFKINNKPNDENNLDGIFVDEDDTEYED